MKNSDIYMFGIGALLSTFIFLTTITGGAGSVTKLFLSENLMILLNVVVGILLICFGFKMIWKR